MDPDVIQKNAVFILAENRLVLRLSSESDIPFPLPLGEGWGEDPTFTWLYYGTV